MSSMSLALGAAALIGVAGVGCAAGGQAVATDSAAWRAPDVLEGEDFSVRRDDTGLRGTSAGAPVALEWRGGYVVGTYRSLPVHLAVKARGAEHEAQGELGGSDAALRFSADQLEGYLAGCAVKASRQADGSFSGGRTCGASDPEPLHLRLPAAIWTRAPPERAAWIALALSETSGPRSVGGPGHAGAVHSQYREKIRSRKCNTRAMGE